MTVQVLSRSKYPSGRTFWVSWLYKAMRSPFVVKWLFGMKVLSEKELQICFPQYDLPAIYFTITTILLKGLLKEKLKRSPNLTLLEIGTGPFAILSGCLSRWTTQTIDATDIDPAFVASAQKHVELNKVNVRLFQSDLFDNVPTGKKYDVIFWNPPTELDANIYLPRLFETVPDFLNEGGQLIIVYNHKRLAPEIPLKTLSKYNRLQLRKLKTWWWNIHDALLIDKN